ncbi:Rpp20 subunit of nuclear RNase MRP and P-domain-containing protein [Geopyxis carbonaria]|nr:Rpp20 subunit of nuclear RNase MRP and P-domain-containing protein [Geopyxis carbonaria]
MILSSPPLSTPLVSPTSSALATPPPGQRLPTSSTLTSTAPPAATPTPFTHAPAPPAVATSLPTKKRALQHAPTTGRSDKTFYLAAGTPFVRALKWVQGAMAPAATLTKGKRGGKQGGGERVERVERVEARVKATGRAIDKALQLGVWAMEQRGWSVRVETGTVWTVDDVLEGAEPRVRKKRKGKGGDVEMGGMEGEQEEVEAVERGVNYVEIVVTKV